MVLLKMCSGPHCSCPLGSLCPSRHVLSPAHLPFLIGYSGLQLLLLEICCFRFLYLLLTGCNAWASLAGQFYSIACSTGTKGLSSLCPGQAWPPHLLAPVAGDGSQHVRCDHWCILHDPCSSAGLDLRQDVDHLFIHWIPFPSAALWYPTPLRW